MTPVTKVIDRSFRGVGRISKASGTSNPALIRKYHRMLDAFKDDGQIDLLRGIRDGVLTFAECYDAFRRGAMHELATTDTAKPLAKAFEAWRVSASASPKHRASRATSGDYLKRLDGSARVADLPRLLRKLNDTLGATHPRSYNMVRSAASAFLRDTLTKAHPLYHAVIAVPARPKKRKRKGRPFTLAQLRNYFPSPDTDHLDAIAWGMATTGMGQGEYWGRWHVLADRIHIDGTKRDQRVRDIPLVRRPSVPTMHQQTFEKKFRDRVARAFQPYDLRRTFTAAMDEAGITRTRRRLYMGHGEKDVTDLYEHHEVRRFLADDAATLQAFFGLPPVKAAVKLDRKDAAAR